MISALLGCCVSDDQLFECSSQAKVLWVHSQNCEEENMHCDGWECGSWKWASYKNSNDDYYWHKGCCCNSWTGFFYLAFSYYSTNISSFQRIA